MSIALRVLLLSTLAWTPAALAQLPADPVPPSAPAATATLSGVVVDARTKQPLARASVELRDPAQSASTDAEGRFRFESVPVGPRELFVSMVGYGFGRYPVELPAEGTSVTISLAEGAAAYNEAVTVEGDVLAMRELGVAGQQSLGSAELRQLGGMTLDDPLRAVQSLAGATGTDDFYGELTVRGHNFQRLNYTLDGVPAGSLIHALKFVEDGASVTMINSDAVEEVSLLRGAYPQRYGARLGAGLEFASSEGSRERPRYSLLASGTNAALSADGPLGGRGSWLVSARRSYLDLFISQVLDDSSLAFGFGNVLGKMVIDASSRDQIQVAALAGRSRFDERDAGPDALDTADHAGWMGSLAWRHTRASKTTVNQLTSRFFATGESYDNHNGAGDLVVDGGASDYGVRMDFSSAATGRLFELGGSYERLAARDFLTFRVPGWHVLGGEDYDTDSDKIGLYGQARFAVGPATIGLGSRFDRFGLTDDWVASPWLLADFQATDRLRLILSAGRHHQFPAFAQVAGRRGDPGLLPEQATHLDVGVEGELKGSLRWQVIVYGREERDVMDLPGQYPRLVGGVRTPVSTTSLWANRLEGESRGVEFMLQRRSPSGLSGWIAYSLGRTRYTDQVTGERFDGDFDQRHTLSLFGRYRLSDRMSVNARWRYGSNRPAIGYLQRLPDGRQFLGDQRNSLRVPAYSRVDVRADRTYRWGRRRLTVFAEVSNVLNHENLAQTPPFVSPESGQVFEKFREQFPIVPSLGFALEF